MSKLQRRTILPPRTPTSPVKSVAAVQGVASPVANTSRDAKSELFLLAVTNFVSENTAYEGGTSRDTRFAGLIAQVVAVDPDWVRGLLGWMRGPDVNLRAAALVGACEYVKAGGPSGRQLISTVCQRADEPADVLAYWMSTFGRNIPAPVKRGVTDAAVRLYNEWSALKWDGAGQTFRFGDVIELTHPSPKDAKQAELFRHMLSDRHRGTKAHSPEGLSVITGRAQLDKLSVEDRQKFVNGHTSEALAADLKSRGATWEWATSWYGAKPTAHLWESLIPEMGYMALLRNLRNFDEAAISKEAKAKVAAVLTDPVQVEKSRQMPMRFLSAYKHAPNVFWAPVLEEALTYTLRNVPAFPGRTLVLVDTSGSMDDTIAGARQSKDGVAPLKRYEAAAMFGIAVGMAAQDADVVAFSNTTCRFPLVKGGSLLPQYQTFISDRRYNMQGGTATGAAVRTTYRDHDRVLILTDEQANMGTGSVDNLVPAHVPLFTFNLAGYQKGHGISGSSNRHTFGGLTDAAFRLIALLDSRKSVSWPWE